MEIYYLFDDVSIYYCHQIESYQLQWLFANACTPTFVLFFQCSTWSIGDVDGPWNISRCLPEGKL